MPAYPGCPGDEAVKWVSLHYITSRGFTAHILWLLGAVEGIFCCGCVAEKADNEADPEDEEYDMLNMPPQHVVVNRKSFVSFPS